MTTVGDERRPGRAPLEQDNTARGLARGSLTVAVGLGVTGTATLAMIALVDHRLPGTSARNAFNQWWLITTLLVTPFGVFEAYLARLVAAAQAAGTDPTEIVGSLLGRSWLVAALVSVGSLAAGGWLNSAEFGRRSGLVLLLPVWVFLLATQAVQRGVATGKRRFLAIAVQLSTDGLLRIGLTSAVLWSGHATAELVAVVTCVSAAAGIGAGGVFCRGWFASPVRTAAGVSWRPILLLLVASVCPVLAGNAPAPWLNAVYHHHEDTVIAFAAAVTLSRIPTQFVSAAFGPLLSHLTHAVETGDRARFDRLTRLADGAAVVLGAGFVAVFAVVGVWLLPHYAATPVGSRLGMGTLAVLALASALMFVAVVQQAGLAAMERWDTIAAAWAVGLVSLVVVLALPVSAVTRAAAAPAAAIATAVALMLVARHLRPGSTARSSG